MTTNEGIKERKAGEFATNCPVNEKFDIGQLGKSNIFIITMNSLFPIGQNNTYI